MHEWVVAQMDKHTQAIHRKKRSALYPHRFSNSLAKSKNPIGSIILAKGSKKN